MRQIDGVNDVHDLHVWSIGSETRALSCHISIADIPPSVSERILRDVKDRLRDDFHIAHTTIQFENVDLRSGAWLRDSGGGSRAPAQSLKKLQMVDCRF